MSELALLRYLHKILPPFRLNAVFLRNSHPRDPLDISATSHLPPNLSQVHSGVNPEDNAHQRASLQSSSTPSSTINILLRNMQNSNWWSILTDRAVSLIVDVPLAQGKECDAAAGTPKGNSGYMVDDDPDPDPLSPTQNPNSQRPSTAANTNSGEHGNGLLCFCS
ncbi:hypothetical protein K503DRAFT_804291 [Rhizopogon vinicolor AM-OR11-026]|uniref:Uncharacterized protein n=1 Tax=Rhizopogon vinicolor AM-OR11-026 TaxID=1314800 RepID=A0A1B7MLU0_9AGAM|nr:hypothetical protein K503DRAFT_804291 [Rhizopogon vinicolor AM-OR11-026]